MITRSFEARFNEEPPPDLDVENDVYVRMPFQKKDLANPVIVKGAGLKPCLISPEEKIMVIHGRVHNGVVLLPEGIHLAEGQAVTVFAAPPAEARTHSILDIEPVSVGVVMRPLTADDDILDEMLEGRS